MLIKNDSGEEIKLETIRISCKSDNYVENTPYGVVIVYRIDTSFTKKEFLRNIYPGYVIIKSTAKDSPVDLDPSKDESMIHGKLIHWYF